MDSLDFDPDLPIPKPVQPDAMRPPPLGIRKTGSATENGYNTASAAFK